MMIGSARRKAWRVIAAGTGLLATSCTAAVIAGEMFNRRARAEAAVPAFGAVALAFLAGCTITWGVVCLWALPYARARGASSDEG